MAQFLRIAFSRGRKVVYPDGGTGSVNLQPGAESNYATLNQFCSVNSAGPKNVAEFNYLWSVLQSNGDADADVTHTFRARMDKIETGQ